MDLLFINALKGLKKKKLQMLAIAVMVMLSTGIYTAMNTSLDRLEDRYYTYLEEQNVEYFSFEPVIDYNEDLTLGEIDFLLNNEFKNITEKEKLVITNYKKCLTKKTCNEETLRNVSAIFEMHEAFTFIANKKLDTITSEYQFYYEYEQAKITTDDKFVVKAIPLNIDKKINKPFLIDGKFPSEGNEITVLPNFAKKNKLKIGDEYKVNDSTYKIVGFAYEPSHIYPLLSINSPIFDEKYNNIIYVLDDEYEKFVGFKDNTYVAQFNDKISYENRLVVEVGQSQNEENSNPIFNLFENESDKLQMGMSTAIRIMRTDSLQLEFSSTRLFADAFLYLLLGISVFIILVITKKRIDDERLQIGVLKSLGYNSFSIATSYLVYPILGSIVGGSIGYLIGIFLNTPLAHLYLSYYTVPLSGFVVDPKYIMVSVFVPLIVLSLLSYFIALFMLRKKPLSLLKEGSNLKVNWFSKLITKITSFLPFKSRFKYSLASRSFGKLLIVSLTSFATGMLIVLTLIGMNLFNSMIDRSFEGMKFKYMVSYIAPQFDSNDEDDLVIQMEYEIEEIKRNGTLVDIKEDNKKINLTGIDKEPKYLKILDEKENDITHLLDETGIIINKNISEILEIKIGDELKITINNEPVYYNVVAISENFIGRTGYVIREELSSKMGMPNFYVIKYSNNDIYDSMKNLGDEDLSKIGGIFNLKDLEENVRKQMQSANASIYIVIGFASFMSLVIIAVIANIVVEENKKTISLMKVMGYKNKEISNVVLNIYTPFVIIFYLLSIPAMIEILKKIVNILTGDIEMAIPIELSPLMASFGLLTLLVAYYIAINLSRKVLNRVPLAVALKRE